MVQLPNHVLKYLAANGVDQNELPEAVQKTLAGLKPGEVATLQKVGDSLRGNNVACDIIIKVH